jgi:hypothetical protein
MELKVSRDVAETLLTSNITSTYAIIASVYLQYQTMGSCFHVPMYNIANAMLPVVPGDVNAMQWISNRTSIISTIVSLSSITDMDNTAAIDIIVQNYLDSFKTIELPPVIMFIERTRSIMGYRINSTMVIYALIWVGLHSQISDSNIFNKIYNTLVINKHSHYIAIINTLLRNTSETHVLFVPFRTYLAMYSPNNTDPDLKILDNTQSIMHDIIDRAINPDEKVRSEALKLLDSYMRIYADHSKYQLASTSVLPISTQ